MANLHLVTGYAGEEHITSDDQGSFNAAILGEGAFVLDRGNKFSVEVISNTQIRIKDGDILLQGRHIRLNKNRTVDLNIEIGQQGQKRKDLIVVRYDKNRETEVEQANLVVIKGSQTTGTPNAPAHRQGNIVNGDTVVDMPLYTVELNGLNMVGSPKKMFETLLTVKSLQENATQRIEENINTIKSDIVKELEKKMNSKEVLTNLRTSNKTSLVAAINEVFQLGTNSANKIKSKVSALLDKSFSNLTDVATELDKYELETFFREVFYKKAGVKEKKQIYLIRNCLVVDDDIYKLDNFQKLTLRNKVNNFSNFSTVILFTPQFDKYNDKHITNMKLVDTETGNYMGAAEIRSFISDNSISKVEKVVTTDDDILIAFSSSKHFVYSFRKRKKIFGTGDIMDFNLKYLLCNESYFDTTVISMENGNVLKKYNTRTTEIVGNTDIGIEYKNALTFKTYNILTGLGIKEFSLKGQINADKRFVKNCNSNLEYFEFLEANGLDSNFNICRINKNGNLDKIFQSEIRNTISNIDYIADYNSKYLVTKSAHSRDWEKEDLRVLKVDKFLKKVR